MEFLFKYPRNWSSPKFTLRQACNGTNFPNYKLWSHHSWGSKHTLIPRYCDKWLSPLQNIRKLFFMLKNTVPSSKVKTITSICWHLFPLILFRNIYLLYFSFPCVFCISYSDIVILKLTRKWSSWKFAPGRACKGVNLSNYKLWSHCHWSWWSEHTLLPRYSTFRNGYPLFKNITRVLGGVPEESSYSF